MSEFKRLVASSAVVVIGLVGATPEAMAKRLPEDRGLEKGLDPAEPYVRLRDKRVSTTTGVPLALYRVNFKVAPGSGEAMAAQYLRENAGALRLRSDLSDLRYRTTRETPVNRTVRFEQHYQGIPVLDAEIAVSLEQQRDRHVRDERVQARRCAGEYGAGGLRGQGPRAGPRLSGRPAGRVLGAHGARRPPSRSLAPRAPRRGRAAHGAPRELARPGGRPDRGGVPGPGPGLLSAAPTGRAGAHRGRDGHGLRPRPALVGGRYLRRRRFRRTATTPTRPSSPASS